MFDFTRRKSSVAEVVTICIVAIHAMFPTPAWGGEVTEPLLDGMVIEGKANTLQQVSIRVKSFGPGLCEVEITFHDQRLRLPAPPLTWSSWYSIGGAFNGGAYAIGFSPLCDTGALGQVKYIKADPAAADTLGIPTAPTGSGPLDCSLLDDETRSRELMQRDQQAWSALVARCMK